MPSQIGTGLRCCWQFWPIMLPELACFGWLADDSSITRWKYIMGTTAHVSLPLIEAGIASHSRCPTSISPSQARRANDGARTVSCVGKRHLRVIMAPAGDKQLLGELVTGLCQSSTGDPLSSQPSPASDGEPWISLDQNSAGGRWPDLGRC